MKFKEIKTVIGDKVSTKKLQAIINKITPAEFRSEMRKKDGSIINIIKRKVKSSSE